MLNRTFELKLDPTERYSELIPDIKKLLTCKVSSLDFLKISWMGEEPLLSKAIIYEISHHVQKLLLQYPLLDYQSCLRTKAHYLDEWVLEELVKLGIKNYQIILENLDRGVWSNLLGARDSALDFSMILKLEVTPENVLDLYEWVDYIKSAFGYDPRFSLFFKASELAEGISFQSLYGKTQEEILKKFDELVGNVLIVNKSEEPESSNCLFIRSNGEINPSKSIHPRPLCKPNPYTTLYNMAW